MCMFIFNDNDNKVYCILHYWGQENLLFDIRVDVLVIFGSTSEFNTLTLI